MAILTAIITIIVTLCAIVLVYFKWTFRYWSRRNVPTPPTIFPFGNAKDSIFQKDSIGEHLENIYKDYKCKGLKYCGYYFLIQPQLILFDLDLIRTVMSKDFLHFTDHTDYVNEKIDPLSGHLFSLKGLKWKNLRVKLTPTFTSGKMKMMFQTLLDCSDQLTTAMDKMVKDREEIDIKEVMGRFTTDIIGSCAFGIDCNSLKDPNSEFRKYGKRSIEDTPLEALKLLIAILIPAVLEFFNIPLTKSDVSKFFMNMVKETVAYREKNNVVRKDFMHLLIQLKNNVKIKDEDSVGQLRDESNEPEAGKSLTIEELAAQAFVFFIAGFETSSTTLSFCFYELVTNPEVQAKLREEINDIMEKHDGKLTYNAIMQMTYMEKCLDETLRKYPPVPVLTRECTQEYTMPDSNITLPKGTQILIPIMAIQRDSENFPDPLKFDPERFSSEKKSKRHPYAWLPFGEGPRACIGIRFGMMQTKIALAIMLKNYKFTLNSKTRTPITLDPKAFFITAVGGIWLNAEKISA